MNEARSSDGARVLRERQIWIAAVAVLGTSTLWLAVLTGTLLARSMGDGMAALAVVSRALVAVVVTYRHELLIMAGAALAVMLLIVTLLLPREGERSIAEEVRHA